MELTTCARPYAKAAFQLARELGQLDEWSRMLTLCASVSRHEAVDRMLNDPSTNGDMKAEAFIQLCEGSLTVEVENYIRILTNKKRISLLPHIDALFEQMKSQDQSYQDVIVTSAFPLTESQEEKIAKKVKQRLGQSVRMQIQIDSELVGGVIVKAGDLVIDGSVRARLSKLADAMIS
ncbi:F0F1 ATP synthase subunit delta [Endozoicomonas euniceicola]|uniref:ATP synthase subunit delta n=1 Tax=Endozoicomonas euniceicola TaxID=1234143 RepID=A0ABY6H033_9GAMM|nr:F0F1 ATP synthase subunit delta [Endozoicomonas euniceicola]UYM18402.1 F0F1 ATP synthase subunit delta [Endozoicomonas euniceicola]